MSADYDHRPAVCPACLTGAHGPDCEAHACPCRCRAMLGIDGPFPFGDPTAPFADDRVVA